LNRNNGDAFASGRAKDRDAALLRDGNVVEASPQSIRQGGEVVVAIVEHALEIEERGCDRSVVPRPRIVAPKSVAPSRIKGRK
jgi:hypothetical protein